MADDNQLRPPQSEPTRPVAGMPAYYGFHWNESRGDEHDDWGTSTWYLEVGSDGYATRQIEVYCSGPAKRYDSSHLEDANGGLTTAPVDPAEFTHFGITAADFETAWATR